MAGELLEDLKKKNYARKKLEGLLPIPALGHDLVLRS